jgi:acyl carrier protein
MNTEERIKHFILEELQHGNSKLQIDSEEELISSGVIDSLALLRLIVFIEERFGVTVEDGDVVPDNFETVNSIKAFVEKKQAH